MTIPLIILGGSDRKASRLPPTGQDKHPLAGYKGIDIRIGDRYLIEEVVDRFQANGSFGPIYIAGPARIYKAARFQVPIIDTDGSFGDNIRRGIEAVREEVAPGPIAITTCDILPEPDQLEVALAAYRKSAPCGIWFPMIEVPEDQESLGAFGWKPTYRIPRREGDVAKHYLPGHLVFFDPKATRLRFTYRMVGGGYQTRNRSITYRRWNLLMRVLLGLLTQDLARLFTFRIPNVTWTIVRAGMPASHKLREGTLSSEEVDTKLTLVFLKNRHQRQHPDQGVRVELLANALSLAEDIDTLEEARARGATPEDSVVVRKPNA
jgi:hypothetical protein